MNKTKKFAVIIENENQLRQYKTLCEKKAVVFSCPKKDKIIFPHYQILMPVGKTVHSLYNDEFENGPFSVLAMGFNLLPFTLFKKNMELYLTFKEDFYEN